MESKDKINEFIKNLDLSGLRNISQEELSNIKHIAEIYTLYISDYLDKMPIKDIFNSIIEKFYISPELSISIREKHIVFNDLSEVLAFIIFVIDPNYNMANKYLSFLEQTSSNTKAILLHKQYANQYHAFFETKILYGELILQEKEKELLEENKRKRTIIG